MFLHSSFLDNMLQPQKLILLLSCDNLHKDEENIILKLYLNAIEYYL